ncbi:aspartyl protease family protein [Tenacibaculum sp. UWU-22]|uniref:aspartyl protease family protein n=1 Tax=Tenacibaculum sp. UWU-22 TaxID=3234187 RepID=UPI0034DB37A7
MKKLIILLVFFLLLTSVGFAQRGFQFRGANDKKQTVKFKLINNLIVIPLEINGKKLSFLLDSGANKTILFNFSEKDTINLNNVEKVTLQGLGSGESVESLLSKNNQFKLNNLVSTNQNLYVILRDNFNISSKMGITIHGIIGYNLLKNVIARINYNTKQIDFYNPKYFKYPKCRKCETFPLEFYRNKPYINVNVQLDTVGKEQIPVKVLIDSGGSDALWLFENTKGAIKTPIKNFKDILGEGLSGTIYGNRSKIPQISLQKYVIKNPTATFLDSISTHNARKFKTRNGSIGGAILKRFKIWIDYTNKKITFKKSASLSKPFYYNMSGLHIVYAGKELVKEAVKTTNSKGGNTDNTNDKKNTISMITSYHYVFYPAYEIDKVVKGSPAAIAGVLSGDKLLKVNGKKAHHYTLDQLMELFHTKPNKKIRLEVRRAGLKLTFEFQLKKRI